jgi:DNA-binding MarR family transcriptional regulator
MTPRSTQDRLGIRIGFLIHDVSRLRRALFDASSPHLDITRSQAWVLTGISRRRGGISQADLARILGLGKVATGEFVADLERLGYVLRRRDRGDRRAYRVQLTARGRRMLASISAVVVGLNVEVFRDFSSRDLARFAADLKAMKLQLQSMLESVSGQSPSANSRVRPVPAATRRARPRAPEARSRITRGAASLVR